MENDKSLDGVDSPIAELVELFRGQLADVRFPGVDMSVLDEAIQQMTIRAAEVERLRSDLADARDALTAEQHSLRDKARQAHAYARVYATGNDELTDKLEQIVFDAPKQRAAKKPRTRRVKVAAPQLVLGNEPLEHAANGAS